MIFSQKFDNSVIILIRTIVANFLLECDKNKNGPIFNGLRVTENYDTHECKSIGNFVERVILTMNEDARDAVVQVAPFVLRIKTQIIIIDQL